MIQASPVAAVFEGAAAAAEVDTPVATTTTEDPNDIENDDDNNNNEQDMSSEATHSRKSRLAVPAGGDDAMPVPASSSASSAAGGTGIGGGNSAGTTTTGGASSSAAGSASASGLPLLSRKHRAGGAAAGGGGTGSTGGGGMMSNVLLSSSNSLRPMHYFSRLTDVRQMDIQSALDQMKTLLSTRPQVVYKTSYYRKQTKNHWARDDPAFCALQALFLLVAAIAYSVAFRCTLTGAISFLLYAVIWNWLGMGLVLATTCREIANRQLTAQQTSASHVRQQVEWLYAFDIHCNAFFPVFVVLYALQFFLLPIVLGQGLLPLILANTLYGAALSWYWYITHLGYRSLPFLSNTEVFLFPIAAVILLYAVMLFGYPFGFGWNAARVMVRFYFL